MIYFITDGRYTKIGYSYEPDKRLKELQTGNPFPLRLVKVVNGDYGDEGKIHRSLSLYRLNGEWFDFKCFDDDILDFLLEGDCGAALKKKSEYKGMNLKEINSKRRDKTSSLVKKAVNELLLTDNDFITAQSIRDGLEDDVSLSTVRRYMEVFKDEIDSHNNRVFGTSNFITYKKTLSIHKIKGAIQILNDANERLSRRKVAKEAGVHFNPVQNLWDDEDIQSELDKYNSVA